MSRYTLESHDGLELEIVVGWDPPLATFFAQVWPNWEGCDVACLVLWCGINRGEIQTVEQLADVIADYANIPKEIKSRLRKDSQYVREPLVRLD